MVVTTEMDKLLEAGEKRAVLVEFLDWIDGHPELVLAEWLRVNDRGEPRAEPLLVPRSRSADTLIYDFLGIDANALEEERRAFLKAI